GESRDCLERGQRRPLNGNPAHRQWERAAYIGLLSTRVRETGHQAVSQEPTMTTKIKNRPENYITRSMIGGAKRTPRKQQRKKNVHGPVDFEVDEFGYFIW